MLHLTRTIASWRYPMALAGLLTVMATNVATAMPRHPRQGPQTHNRQCATCVAVGPQNCGVHTHGHDAGMVYRRGYAAGKQAGWQAGYSAGLGGCRYAAIMNHRLNGRQVQYQLGFRAGYAEAYAQGYSQGRAESRPRPRPRFRLRWNW